MINLLGFWESYPLEVVANMVSLSLLVLALYRIFNHINLHNKALWKMKDKVNDLGAWRDEDMNSIVHLEQRIVRLEQKISKLNERKSNPKKKASK